jgi:hypothetical protein
MIIQKKRVRNIQPYFGHLRPGARFAIGVRATGVLGETLRGIGFTEEARVGESILPSGTFGPVSRYNAEGKYIVHKDQPMETSYRMVEWHWEEWRGRYDREEQSRIVDVPYQRYPRTFYPPPGVEFSIAEGATGEQLIIGPVMTWEPDGQQLTLHTVNLFLEIFSQCEIFTEQLEAFSRAPVRRVNWHILPPGRRP